MVNDLSQEQRKLILKQYGQIENSNQELIAWQEIFDNLLQTCLKIKKNRPPYIYIYIYIFIYIYTVVYLCCYNDKLDVL